MTEIEEKIEILQDICAKTGGLLQNIQIMRSLAKQEIDSVGLTPNTCREMARAMQKLHENTAQLHNGGHLVHALMQPFVPPDASEGNKTWPPQP